MAVFIKNLILAGLFASALSFAGSKGKPPLMPLVQPDRSTNSTALQGGASTDSSPPKIGFQFGLLSIAQSANQPTVPGDTFMGGRVFTRYSLGGRWYLMPSVGYYRMVTTPALGSAASNIADAGLQLDFALLRLGGWSLLAGLTQRAGLQFSTDSSNARNLLYYRIGPGANLNIKVSNSLNLMIGSDVVVPISSALQPELTAHAGFLFNL